MKNDCVFCAIAAGEIPCFKVYEDDLVLAYLDINPFSEGHTLVIPKAHTTGLLDTPEETLTALLARVKKVAAHLKATLPCDGFHILQNNGVAPYHICYVVDNVMQAVEDLYEEGFKPLFMPVPSVAMNNREICYMFHAEVGFIEVVGKE